MKQVARKAIVTRILGVCCLLLAGIVGVCRAGEDNRPKAVVHGDVAIPIHPSVFSQGFSLGLGGGVGMIWPLSGHFALAADVEYITFGVDSDEFVAATGLPPGASVEGDQIATLYASLGLKWNILTSVDHVLRPYIAAGAGYFRYNPDGFAVNGMTLTGFDNENTVGAHVGLGVDAVLAPYLELFLDVIYVVGFTGEDPTSYLSIRPGVAFDLKAGE